MVNTTNWTAGVTAEKFFTGDSVIFGNGPTNRNINLAVAVLPGSLTVNNSTANRYTIGGGGLIGGSTGLTKSGDGTLIISTSNTYTGPNTINAGTVQLGAASASGDLGTGLVTNNATLAVNRSDSFVLTNVIEGTGEVRQLGPGTLTLSGISTYDGATTVAGGTLRVTNASSLGSTIGPTLVANGATLDLAGNNSTGGLTLNGVISETGGPRSMTKTAGNTLTLTAANTYTGATNLNGGAVEFSTLNNLGLGTLLISGSLSATTGVTANSGMLKLGAADRLNDAAPLTLANATFNSNGFSEALGVFTLGGSANFDLGTGTSHVHFAESSAAFWSGTLSIMNWSGSPNGTDTDQIFFGTSDAGIDAFQLSLITFVEPFGFGSGTRGARMLPTGELVAIPEPNSLAALCGGLGILCLGRGRRLFRGLQ